MKDEFLEKLKERYENGEISKETYEDIKARYLREMEGRETEEKTEEKEEEKRRDYKCAGSCTLPGGNYGMVSVSGSLRVEGEIVAEKISVAGSLKGSGSIKAESIRVAGSIAIDGDIEGETISIAGGAEGRRVQGDNIKIAGILKCVEIHGDYLRLGGAVRAEIIKADTLRIEMDGKSVVGRIEGDDIEIRAKRGFFKRYRGSLGVKEIKGSTVKLENVQADYVEAETVIVGDGCRIEKLRANERRISNKSWVDEIL